MGEARQIRHKLATVIDVQRPTIVFQSAAVAAEPIKGKSVVYNSRGLTCGRPGGAHRPGTGIMIWEFSGICISGKTINPFIPETLHPIYPNVH